MDKSKWEYKKLGELGNICTGGTPPTKDARNYSSDDYCFVKPSDLTDERVLFLDDSEFHVSSYAYSNSRKLPKGSVLVCCIGSIGKLGVLNMDATCNQQINAIIPNLDMDSKFIAYSLLASKGRLLDIANAPVVPIINKSQFSNFEIKIYPFIDQQRIVSELDCLNEMIAVKQEQLKEFDKLAQSIFYDMFGDPLFNEKGWIVKTLGEIGTLQRGRGIQKKDFVVTGRPCIHYGQLHTSFSEYATKHISCISQDLYDVSIIAHRGDLIMALTSEDVEGSCKSTAWLGDYDIAVSSDAAVFSHNQGPIYVSYYTKTRAFFNEKQKYANGFKVTHIKSGDIASIPIPLPPLSLQQQFADKISAIEAQKELVKQSIAETQQLLDYTMEKYFGYD